MPGDGGQVHFEEHRSDSTLLRTGHNATTLVSIRMVMDVEALISAALREAGYEPDAIGSALPRIMRILQAEDVRIAVGRSLSRKEREYVRLQLELGLSVPEIVAALQR
jgi:hypothetical protein